MSRLTDRNARISIPTASPSHVSLDADLFYNELDTRFKARAKEVFGQVRDPYKKAIADAQMMWLAWRGNDKYVQAHLGDQAGKESSWQFLDYKDVPSLIERCKHMEVRPINPPFADHIIAHFAILMRKLVDAGRGVRVYSTRLNVQNLDLTEAEVNISDTYRCIKEGSEVYADWIKLPGKILKSKSVALSSERFLYVDFASDGDKTPASARGFIYFFKKQDRAAARRRHRQSAVKWVTSR